MNNSRRRHNVGSGGSTSLMQNFRYALTCLVTFAVLYMLTSSPSPKQAPPTFLRPAITNEDGVVRSAVPVSAFSVQEVERDDFAPGAYPNGNEERDDISEVVKAPDSVTTAADDDDDDGDGVADDAVTGAALKDFEEYEKAETAGQPDTEPASTWATHTASDALQPLEPRHSLEDIVAAVNQLHAEGKTEQYTARSMPYSVAFEPVVAPAEIVFQRDFDCTLVTQTDVYNLWMMRELQARWRGPMAVAVYITSAADNATYTSFMEGAAFYRPNVALVTRWGSPKVPYPINSLRNDALDLVVTSHFLLTDMDSWPSIMTYDLLRGMSTSVMRDNKLAIVIPTFARKEKTCVQMRDRFVCDPPAPSSFPELRTCVYQKHCSIYKEYIDDIYYSTTDLPRWWREPASRTPRVIRCFDGIKYEPHFIVRKTQDLPYFDERFNGYGKNKLQYITHLRYLGYTFAVLPRAFLCHVPHLLSSARNEWEDGGKAAVDALFGKFKIEMAGKIAPQVKLCAPGQTTGSTKRLLGLGLPDSDLSLSRATTPVNGTTASTSRLPTGAGGELVVDDGRWDGEEKDKEGAGEGDSPTILEYFDQRSYEDEAWEALWNTE